MVAPMFTFIESSAFEQVIYFVRYAPNEFWMLTLYAKAKRDDIWTPARMARLKEFQTRISGLERLLAVHPDGDKVQRTEGPTVAARKAKRKGRSSESPDKIVMDALHTTSDFAMVLSDFAKKRLKKS